MIKGKSRWYSKRRNYDLPLIAPEAIKAYLSRRLDNYDFLKQVPHEELAEHARALGFRYVTEPRISQLVCNIIAAQEPRFLFYKDMGGGKSKTILDIIRWRKSRRELQRALIVVPEFIHIDSWKEQLREHAPDLRFLELAGDKNERFELMDKKADVCLINYAGLAVYMGEKKKKKDGGGKLGVEGDAAALFASSFNLTVFEELHRLNSITSLTFRLFCWLSAGAAFVYATDGSPFGRDPMRVWGQFKVVDEGETFGTTVGMFRASLFDAKKQHFGGYDYKFKEEREADFARLLKHRSIAYDRTELKVELPHRTDLRRDVRMSREQAMYYSRIVDRMKEAKGDYRSLENIYVRMRQCASGFLSLRADDESRIEVDMSPNPKIEALREVLLELPPHEKILIFYHFHHSGHKVRKLLDEMKIPWATLYGRNRMQADGIPYSGQYERFVQEKRCRALVAQDQAASEAINPHHVCDYLWFYERPDDPLISEQAENRVDRPGKSDPVFIGDLVMLGTKEAELLVAVREGRNMRKGVLHGEVRL